MILIYIKRTSVIIRLVNHYTRPWVLFLHQTKEKHQNQIVSINFLLFLLWNRNGIIFKTVSTFLIISLKLELNIHYKEIPIIPQIRN